MVDLIIIHCAWCSEFVFVCPAQTYRFDLPKVYWFNLRFARLEMGHLGNRQTCVQSYKRFIRNSHWSVEMNMFWQTCWVMDYIIRKLKNELDVWTHFSHRLAILFCVWSCASLIITVYAVTWSSNSKKSSRTCFFYLKKKKKFTLWHYFHDYFFSCTFTSQLSVACKMQINKWLHKEIQKCMNIKILMLILTQFN